MLHHSEVFDSVRLTVTLAIAPIKLFLVELLSLCYITNALDLNSQTSESVPILYFRFKSMQGFKAEFYFREHPLPRRRHDVCSQVTCTVQLCTVHFGERRNARYSHFGGSSKSGDVIPGPGSMTVHLKCQWSRLYKCLHV